MAKARYGIDSKELAVLCIDCGGWPAPVRPDHRLAYCTTCASKKAL